MGRFAKGKNVPWMIQAWAGIADQFPDWSFDIYGVGPEEGTIALEILKSGVSRSVRVMGSTQNPESVSSSSRLMIMGSDHEGLPVAVVEAALCGIPTLTVDSSPGMSVLVEDGVTGAITPKGDIDEIRRRLVEILTTSCVMKRWVVTHAVGWPDSNLIGSSQIGKSCLNFQVSYFVLHLKAAERNTDRGTAEGLVDSWVYAARATAFW